MVIIKSYTDLEQSKKLAEILPLESADMCWINNLIEGLNYTEKFSANLYTVKEMKDAFDAALNGWDKYWKLIPCWSLSALLNYLREIELFPEIDVDDSGVTMNISYYDRADDSLLATIHNIKVKEENFIDACYKMILKLLNK